MKRYFTVMAWVLFGLAALVPRAKAVTHIQNSADVLVMALLVMTGVLSLRRSKTL
jgi:hypothetical protein